ncbi:hypothetical protein ABK040_009905 [Willaertia magna]
MPKQHTKGSEESKEDDEAMASAKDIILMELYQIEKEKQNGSNEDNEEEDVDYKKLLNKVKKLFEGNMTSRQLEKTMKTFLQKEKDLNKHRSELINNRLNKLENISNNLRKAISFIEKQSENENDIEEIDMIEDLIEQFEFKPIIKEKLDDSELPSTFQKPNVDIVNDKEITKEENIKDKEEEEKKDDKKRKRKESIKKENKKKEEESVKENPKEEVASPTLVEGGNKEVKKRKFLKKNSISSPIVNSNEPPTPTKVDESSSGNSKSTTIENTTSTTTDNKNEIELRKQYTNELKQILLNIVKDIEKIEEISPFLEPVNAKEVPGYFKVILRPTDLSTIKSLINEGSINSVIELWRNLSLMLTNCIMFSNGEYDININAKKQRIEIRELITKAKSKEELILSGNYKEEISNNNENNKSNNTKNENKSNDSNRKRRSKKK